MIKIGTTRSDTQKQPENAVGRAFMPDKTPTHSTTSGIHA
ncbi:hypothetical protein GCWU000324_02537 [Kingella oralis ATCC 51147]|uniref:Uncharacterized protein n=1 Tax=Kingella oralis ATCC 51147 TaxID=629741 RepID=C4GLG6_9NEIS|nr:hypothetical protein GCWU000324_02537 [Kingella oralis ATCC 51147]